MSQLQTFSTRNSFAKSAIFREYGPGEPQHNSKPYPQKMAEIFTKRMPTIRDKPFCIHITFPVPKTPNMIDLLPFSPPKNQTNPFSIIKTYSLLWYMQYMRVAPIGVRRQWLKDTNGVVPHAKRAEHSNRRSPKRLNLRPLTQPGGGDLGDTGEYQQQGESGEGRAQYRRPKSIPGSAFTTEEERAWPAWARSHCHRTVLLTAHRSTL